MILTRYWFEFEPNEKILYGFKNYGVTAWNYDDALNILKQDIFKDALPPIKLVIEDVDISTLDAGHVLPNMFPPTKRGIWFPMI